MLTREEEKVIRSLHTKKGRKTHGLCLVEGEKSIEAAGDAVVKTFTRDDSVRFDQLVTTVSPQPVAAMARIPTYETESVAEKSTIIILDGIQDPGNMGAIFRLCAAFDAGLLLIECADPANPKVIRSSAGTMFHVPWVEVKHGKLAGMFEDFPRPTFLLEKRKNAEPITAIAGKDPIYLVAGSEGAGITADISGTSVFIDHANSVESLNVGHALSIALFLRYNA